MSSSSDSYDGLSPVTIINLGIWVPICVMVVAYFVCSTKYKCCKNTRTGLCCCNIKQGDVADRGRDHTIVMSTIEDRNQNHHQDIYRISSGQAFETLDELQYWYDNFEENSSSPESVANRTCNNGWTTPPPPSYESLFPCSDNVSTCADLPKPV